MLSGEMPPEAEDWTAAGDEPVADTPDEGMRGGDMCAEARNAEHTRGNEPAEDAVLLFVGGPLDGRVEIRAARHGEPLPTVTHVHLHDGPKVVHRYDLQPLTEQAGIYTVRPPRTPERPECD